MKVVQTLTHNALVLLIVCDNRALELLVCVPRPERDEVKSPKFADLDARSTYSATPSHRTDIAARSLYPTQSTPALNWGQDYSEDHSGRFISMRAPHSPFQNGTTSATNAPGSKNAEASTSSTSAHVHFAPSDDISFPVLDQDTAFQHGGGYQYEETWLEEDEDAYSFAKSLFDHHQWERCAALLEKRRVQGDKALFLKLYAKFLVSEAIRAISLNADRLVSRSSKEEPKRITFKSLVRMLEAQREEPATDHTLFSSIQKRSNKIECFEKSLYRYFVS